jgi:hypothetical protein
MMGTTMRQIRIIILLVALVVMTFASFRLSHLEAKRRAIKEDLIELSKIKYGLFSVDEWRMIVSLILTKKVEEFEFNVEQREEMRIKISTFLTKIISDFEDRFHKEKSGSLLGKVQGGIVSITGAMEKVKRDVPVFTEQILDFLAKEDNRSTLQSLMLDKLAEYTDKTFSKIDYTQHDSILVHYKLGDRPTTIEGLREKMKSIRQEETQYLVMVFSFLFIVFILLLVPSQPSKNEFVLFILICLALLRAGLILPMIEIDARIENMSFTLFGEPVDFYDQVLYYKSKSILDVVHLMISQPKWDIKMVGLLVLTFSVLFPLSKLFSSLIYTTYPRIRNNRIIRFMVFRTGKWSMADVMVVAIFMAYIGFSGILTEQLNQLENLSASLDIVTTNKSSLQLGFYLFTSFVILSLVVTHKLQYSHGKLEDEKVVS